MDVGKKGINDRRAERLQGDRVCVPGVGGDVLSRGEQMSVKSRWEGLIDAKLAEHGLTIYSSWESILKVFSATVMPDRNIAKVKTMRDESEASNE